MSKKGKKGGKKGVRLILALPDISAGHRFASTLPAPRFVGLKRDAIHLIRYDMRMIMLPLMMKIAAGAMPLQDADPWKQITREADSPTTTQPASRPARSPFGTSTAGRRPGARPGVVHLSNGVQLPGWISTTTAKPLKLFERRTNRFLDVPLDQIADIESRLDWERMEDDWRWAEQGSDVKVRTGKKYPARKTYYIVKTADGRTITADMRLPIWVELDGKTRRLVLHARDKGPPDTTLDQLIYITKIKLSKARMREVLEKIPPQAPTTQPASAKSRARP